MSDRNQGEVRRLAEEIVYGAPGNKMEKYIDVVEHCPELAELAKGGE